MDKKIKKILRRIEKRPIDPSWLHLRRLESTKMLYAQHPNLAPNVRMANIQLVQNDIAAFRKRLKKRTRLTE